MRGECVGRSKCLGDHRVIHIGLGGLVVVPEDFPRGRVHRLVVVVPSLGTGTGWARPTPSMLM